MFIKKFLHPGNEPTGGQPGPSKPEQMYTASQINEIMRKRVERSHNAFFKRYGVNDLEELDNLVGKANSYEPTKQLYDELQKNHDDLTMQHRDLTKRYAYQVKNINPDKFNDIETYFKGKGIDIDENTLDGELKTHKDWVKKVATVENLGSEVAEQTHTDELQEASNIFGVDLTK